MRVLEDLLGRMSDRWEGTPPLRRRQILRCGVLLVLTLWPAAFLLVDAMASRSDRAAARAMRQHSEVVALAQEVAVLAATRSPLAELPPLQAVQNVAAELGQDSNLVELRSGRANDEETVELRLESMHLEGLVMFLEKIRQEARLKILACTLEHAEGAQFATLQLVLAR